MSSVKELQNVLGPEKVSIHPDDLRKYGKDWLEDYIPNPLCICFPSNIDEVQKIVILCRSQRLAVVPSGGRTGLSGGATAMKGEVIISLEKMRALGAVDTLSRTVTCEAGVITEKVQEAANEAGLYFPVDFGSKGSSHIGGNVSTNAGGIRVLRYGSIRSWVLGLEVVTGTGEILALNGSLVKNNTGYDLVQLFVGSEGTLGIITKVTLKLTNPPAYPMRAFCSVTNLNAVQEIFVETRKNFPDISAFELIDKIALDAIARDGKRSPIPLDTDYYLVLEIPESTPTMREEFLKFLSYHLEHDTIRNSLLSNAVMSESQEQAHYFMALREEMVESLAKQHTLHKNDVAVPVADVIPFAQELKRLVAENYPGWLVSIFGHVGDGNLHVNVLKPEEVPTEAFFLTCREIDKKVFALVKKYRGSVSAEHGVGLKKKEYLSFSRSQAEIDIMRGIKKVFDPDGIMNPGKIF